MSLNPTSSGLGRALFQLGYECSPIILVNGIANSIPGQMLPIIALTEAASFTSSLLHGNLDLDPDNFLAHFRALPGSTLIELEIGEYPFANQSVAANAVISQPLHLSMLMSCPAKGEGAYINKLVTFSALKAALDAHNQSGGTYTVATPSYIYTNCILQRMHDVSRPDTNQAQNAWQFEFVKPLLTQEQGQFVLNSLMNKVSGGLPVSSPPVWSDASSTIGGSTTGILAPASAGASNLIGSASSSIGVPS